MAKPKQEVYDLHPYRWKKDPEIERYKVSTLDYLSALSYNNYALFFRLKDADKRQAAMILKAGLERMLAQVRQLCGTIEKDPQGGHSFTRFRNSTVRYVVQWLDSPEDNYPSFDDLEKSNFSATTLGDLKLWCVSPMTYGEKPEAHPDSSPALAAFKANFVRGGLVFIMHHHHYCNDVLGWTAETHQLAENCYALAHQTAFPSWDPACLDLSRFTKPEVSEESKVDGPLQPERHPDHTEATNVMFAALSPTAPVPQLTISDVISDEVPLSILASYVRALTNSVTQESLDKTLDMVAKVRDRTSMNIRIDSLPPMSILMTDHRDANVVEADFGFGRPVAYRHPMDIVTNGVIIIYPPRAAPEESDEGCEFVLSCERRFMEELIQDEEWGRYFEYRGVDSVDAHYRDGK